MATDRMRSLVEFQNIHCWKEEAMDEKTVVGVHWSFWAVGAISLIFNLIGCMNYI
jgi:hypothetical protein